jgi:hypothetical protein
MALQLEGKREQDEEQAKLDRVAYLKRMMEGGNEQAYDDSKEALQRQMDVLEDAEAEQRKREAHERIMTKAREVRGAAAPGRADRQRVHVPST